MHGFLSFELSWSFYFSDLSCLSEKKIPPSDQLLVKGHKDEL